MFRKLMAGILSLSLVLCVSPITLAKDEEENVVDMRGTRTYIGSASSWSADWDAGNFEDITGEDLSFSGSTLTIRSGRLGKIEADGGCNVTAENLVADSIETDGSITISDSTVDLLSSDSEITVESGTYEEITCSGAVALREGTVKKDIQADSLDLKSSSGKVVIKGNVDVDTMTLPSTDNYSIAKTLTVHTALVVDGDVKSLGKLNGDGTASIEFKDYHGDLSNLSDFSDMILTESSVNAKIDLDLNSLEIDEDSSFTTSRDLKVDDLFGTGEISVYVGKLTIEKTLRGNLTFSFSGSVRSGVTAFLASPGAVDLDDVNVFDYTLKITDGGSYDKIVFDELIDQGVTLSPSSMTLNPDESRTISVKITPDLSKFAQSTEIEWEVIGDSDAFTVKGDMEKATVTFRPKNSGTYTATVRAYLTDGRTRLEDFRSGTVKVTGSSNPPSSNVETASGSTIPFTLDTESVTIKEGNSYFILALTNDTSYPGVYIQGVSDIVEVGTPSAYNRNGKIGWLYEIKAVHGGTTNVVFSNASVRQTCVVTVEPLSTSVTLDTSSVILPAGGVYEVLAITDLKEAPVCSSSNNSVAQVANGVAYNRNGKTGWLYKVNGHTVGTADITIGDQVMHVTVASAYAKIDTKEYTMKPGDIYYIGVTLSGISPSELTVTHQNNVTAVYDAGANSNGVRLYRVVARAEGDDAVIFKLGDQSVQVPIHVKNGVTPSGSSGGGILYR